MLSWHVQNFMTITKNFNDVIQSLKLHVDSFAAKMFEYIWKVFVQQGPGTWVRQIIRITLTVVVANHWYNNASRDHLH